MTNLTFIYKNNEMIIRTATDDFILKASKIFQGFPGEEKVFVGFRYSWRKMFPGYKLKDFNPWGDSLGCHCTSDSGWIETKDQSWNVVSEFAKRMASRTASLKDNITLR